MESKGVFLSIFESGNEDRGPLCARGLEQLVLSPIGPRGERSRDARTWGSGVTIALRGGVAFRGCKMDIGPSFLELSPIRVTSVVQVGEFASTQGAVGKLARTSVRDLRTEVRATLVQPP